ncbi:MAG: hypothetical protein WAT19_05350 [Ferruginibacter sp.]
MHDLIDIYLKVQVAVITMLVPLLIFYINLASNAKKAKDEAYDRKIKELQSESQLDGGDTKEFTKKVNDLHSKIVQLSVQRQVDLNLLNPIKQLKKIYSTLLASFGVILIDIAMRNEVLLPYNHIGSCILIAISLVLFGVSAYLIGKVALVAIKSKEDLENEINK